MPMQAKARTMRGRKQDRARLAARRDRKAGYAAKKTYRILGMARPGPRRQNDQEARAVANRPRTMKRAPIAALAFTVLSGSFVVLKLVVLKRGPQLWDRQRRPGPKCYHA